MRQKPSNKSLRGCRQLQDLSETRVNATKTGTSKVSCSYYKLLLLWLYQSIDALHQLRGNKLLEDVHPQTMGFRGAGKDPAVL